LCGGHCWRFYGDARPDQRTRRLRWPAVYQRQQVGLRWLLEIAHPAVVAAGADHAKPSALRPAERVRTFTFGPSGKMVSE
jgi:hypothetical protein